VCQSHSSEEDLVLIGCLYTVILFFSILGVRVWEGVRGRGEREAGLGRRSRVLSSLENFCHEATGIPGCTLIRLELTALLVGPGKSSNLSFFIA
jgi:hypothetical protein